MARKEPVEYKRYPILLPVDLREDLEYISEKEGHSTLASYIRSELVKLRNQKLKEYAKEGERDE